MYISLRLTLLVNANATAKEFPSIYFTLSLWLLWVSVAASLLPKIKACSRGNAIRVQEGWQRMNVEDFGFGMTSDFTDGKKCPRT